VCAAVHARAPPEGIATAVTSLDGFPALDLGRTAVCLDFDGTLTEIVERADEAVPLAGMLEILPRLAVRAGVVAIISGRPVEYLRSRLPELPAVRYLGLYGDAELDKGEVVLRPAVAAFRPAVHAARDALAADATILRSGAAVEDKPLSVAVHLRPIAPREARTRWSEPLREVVFAVAERHGLRPEAGRLVWELRPPTAGDKGAAVRRVVAESGARAVLVAGDDRGDLAAFAAAAALRGEGVQAVRVAVDSAEAPPELLAAADHVVAGPEGLLALLRSLAPSP
jgi:trehalose 6-phosphate phosphatase